MVDFVPECLNVILLLVFQWEQTLFDLLHMFAFYHTIPTFNNPEKETFCKHCGKRRKCWLPAFSPFPTMFYTLSQTFFAISAAFELLSANALNLDKSNNLSFGKKLTYYYTINSFNALKKNIWKTLLKKEKMLITSIFSFPHHVCYTAKDLFQYFSHNHLVVCKCFRPARLAQWWACRTPDVVVASLIPG